MFFTKLPLLALTSLLSLEAGPTQPSPTTEAAAPARAERRNPDGICGRIECSESQKASLAKIAMTTKEKLRAVHGEGDDRRASLAAAMRDSSLTRAEAVAALDHSGSVEAREEIMVNAFVQVHAVLDAGQRAELASIIETEGMRAIMGHHGKDKRNGSAKGPDKLKAKKARGRGPGDRKAKNNGKPTIDAKANAKRKRGGQESAKR